MKWLDSIKDSKDMNFSKLQETLKDREAWRAAVHGVTELDMTERLDKSNNSFVYMKVKVLVSQLYLSLL